MFKRAWILLALIGKMSVMGSDLQDDGIATLEVRGATAGVAFSLAGDLVESGEKVGKFSVEIERVREEKLLEERERSIFVDFKFAAARPERPPFADKMVCEGVMMVRLRRLSDAIFEIVIRPEAFSAERKVCYSPGRFDPVEELELRDPDQERRLMVCMNGCGARRTGIYARELPEGAKAVFEKLLKSPQFIKVFGNVLSNVLRLAKGGMLSAD